MTTPHITIDTRWSIWIVVTLLAQILGFVRFISKLDSRINVLEQERTEINRYAYSDGKLLEQKVEFFVANIVEIKEDLKEIKNALK
jgi:Tfp pilus assembly protein PilO